MLPRPSTAYLQAKQHAHHGRTNRHNSTCKLFSDRTIIGSQPSTMALAIFNDPFFSQMERSIDRALGRAFGDRSLLGDFPTLLPAAPGSCSTAVANATAGPVSPWVASLGSSTAAACPMDITETQDAYELTADAPGMDQSNIDIQLHEGMLTIKGHRQLAKEEKDAEGRVVRRERTMSHFTRHFTLPDNVDQEGVTASLDKGVLTLRLPKVTPPPKPEPKRITVAAAPVAAPQAVGAAPAGAELPAAAPAAAPEAGGSA